MPVDKISLDSPHTEATEQLQQYFLRAKQNAESKNFPDGAFVKRIEWDEEGGYPEHAWGYVQFSPRPYKQGFGCDGTTDSNIHLISSIVCSSIGIDYVGAYKKAYSDFDDYSWIEEITQDDEVRAETIIPTFSDKKSLEDVLYLMLSDLNQINNGSLVEVLETELKLLGHDMSNWWLKEKELRSWIWGASVEAEKEVTYSSPSM